MSNLDEEVNINVLKTGVVYWDMGGGTGSTGGFGSKSDYGVGSGSGFGPGYGDGYGDDYGDNSGGYGTGGAGYADMYGDGSGDGSSLGIGGSAGGTNVTMLPGYASKDDYLNAWDWSILSEDMEQSHHFHVYIDRLDIGRLRRFKVPLDVNQRNFLPVRNISFTETSFNHLTIPLGIFGDLPFLQKRGIGRINMSIYDNDQEDVAKGIRKWIQDCFPMGKYVDYPSNVVAKMEYHSYNVKGQENVPVSGTYYVIPADNYSYARSYEENALKIINFGVILIGREGYNL